jgi:hypothetical protein
MKNEFFRDEFSINELNFNLNKAGKAIQAVVDAFKTVGVKITDPAQISGLLNRDRALVPESLDKFVFDQLYFKTPAGLSRDRYFELVDLPDLNKLRESFEGLTVGYFGGMRLSDTVHWQVYTIENGKVGINQAELEKIESKFVFAAETKEEISRFKAVQEVCTALNKLVELAADGPVNYNIKGVTTYNESTGQFAAATDFIKKGSVSFGMFFGMESNPVNLKSAPGKITIPEMKEGSPDIDRAQKMAKARNEINH